MNTKKSVETKLNLDKSSINTYQDDIDKFGAISNLIIQTKKGLETYIKMTNDMIDKPTKIKGKPLSEKEVFTAMGIQKFMRGGNKSFEGLRLSFHSL